MEENGAALRMCCKINQQHSRLDGDRSGCFFQTYRIEEVNTRSPGIPTGPHNDKSTVWFSCICNLFPTSARGERQCLTAAGLCGVCIPLARPNLETCVFCAVLCVETAETCTWCLQPPAPLLAACDIFQWFSTSSVVYPTDLCTKNNLCPSQGREH